MGSLWATLRLGLMAPYTRRAPADRATMICLVRTIRKIQHIDVAEKFFDLTNLTNLTGGYANKKAQDAK
jgi:hypothetical protein